jgi:hypothetical protein
LIGIAIRRIRRSGAAFAIAAWTAIGQVPEAHAAQAFDLSGKVVDKRFSPLDGVRVCAASGGCVTTAADGSFRLVGDGTTGIPLRPLSGPPSAVARPFFRLDGRWLGEYRPGAIPGAASARALSGGRQAGPDRLAKAAALSITCSKAGYAPATYSPVADTGKGAVIVMGGAGEAVSALFTGNSLAGWKAIPAGSWVLKDGAMASTGAGRGVLYTAGDYLDYRVIFSVRQISGDHWPCVLYFCKRPPEGQNGLDALGAVQWQPPGTGRWDYRPGKNNDGSAFYVIVNNPHLDRSRWAQCEIIVRGGKGTARMGCCQAVAGGACKAGEMLRFQDASAGRRGPFALQMHNAGIHDEYRDISVEIDPKNDSLFLGK